MVAVPLPPLSAIANRDATIVAPLVIVSRLDPAAAFPTMKFRWPLPSTETLAPLLIVICALPPLPTITYGVCGVLLVDDTTTDEPAPEIVTVAELEALEASPIRKPTPPFGASNPPSEIDSKPPLLTLRAPLDPPAPPTKT